MAQATTRDAFTKKIKVLVADDNPDFRILLGIAINNQTDMRLVQALNRADDILEEIERLQPKILVIDLSMPGKPPLEMIHEVSLRYPTLGVIAFSAYDDKETMDEASRAGATCYINKLEGLQAIITGIRLVALSKEN